MILACCQQQPEIKVIYQNHHQKSLQILCTILVQFLLIKRNSHLFFVSVPVKKKYYFNFVILLLVSDCPVNSLPSNCIMNDDCLGFHCCINIDLKITQRNLSIYFELDACNFQLGVGLGEWNLTKSLLTYIYGTEETYTLGNAITVRYDIISYVNIYLYEKYNCCVFVYAHVH